MKNSSPLIISAIICAAAAWVAFVAYGSSPFVAACIGVGALMVISLTVALVIMGIDRALETASRDSMTLEDAIWRRFSELEEKIGQFEQKRK
jgi:hypothetical protein